jgi:hypothetical protein
MQVRQTARFLVGMYGEPAPAYQWQYSTDGGGTWGNLSDNTTVSGSGTNALWVSNVTVAMNGELFRAIGTNTVGALASTAATLTVNLPQPPLIMTQPADIIVVPDTSGSLSPDVNFGVTVSSLATLSYQWQVSSDGGKTWTATTGSNGDTGTSSVLPVNFDPSMNGDEFRCILSNAGGTLTSRAAALMAPVAAHESASQTVKPGSSVSLAAGEYTGISYQGFSYQWMMNDQPISGATEDTLTLSPVQASTAGVYTMDVVFDSGAKSFVSTALRLSVTKAAPVVVTPPAGVTVKAGKTATFTVAVQGAAPFTYQWEKNGAKLASGRGVLGVTTAKLTVGKVTTVNQGMYQVVVSNSVGKVTSAAAALKVK